MRALIDWSLSETSLTFYSWLKFEDILAAIYQVKCDREDDGKDDKRRRFGERQDWRWKYAKGFLMILGLILILWFPLLLLALPGTTKINPADSMDISVQLTGFSPLYSQSVTRTLLQNFTRDQFEQLRSDNPGLIISYYQPENLQLATFQPSSMTDWPISPPAKTYLMSLLSNMAIELSIFFTWTIYKSNSGVSTTLRGQQLTVLSIENRVQFIQALNTTGSSQADILIKGLYPRFLHAYPDGTVTNLAPSSTPRLVDSILRYHQIASGNNTNGVAASAWWELLDYSDTGTTTSDTVNVTSASTEDRVNPNIYLLSDNVPTIATISSYGVLGLYIAVVFALGRFIRSAISDLTLRIVYEDLPNPDPVLQICSETLLAREFGDFETEETLYWQLITLFRSPQSLMEKTRLNKQD